jgi:FHA domain
MEPTTQSSDSLALLALLPLNGTFERKQINVPFHPEKLKVGRQTNAKTVPTPVNGYFDSKVLSRAHAEVWADRIGKIWIRDVKSSNGTFVNGQRLSPENRDSEPHELREHDTLELGIDIVSEDQKSIVHHKVSAKVEFAGVPGSSNNVLDLNFGDIDPSQGGGLLSSPLSQPMAHSRGRPVAPYNRSAASSMSAGSQMNALNQQRQMNMWGIPLSVEHLVKTLSVSQLCFVLRRPIVLIRPQNEMKTAKQQAQDLDQTSTFLNSLLSTDRRDERTASPFVDNSSSRLVNGKPKLSKIDPVPRFSDPPAPPPQQPLPEKPDTARSSPSETGLISSFRRSETARPGSGMGGSPTNQHSSQILSLVEALSSAKKELDSQGARVKHLEDMLQQERSARESAEERARRLEQGASFKPISNAEAESAHSDVAGVVPERALAEQSSARANEQSTGGETSLTQDTTPNEDNLQSRLSQMVVEMDKMKQDMQMFQQRAEAAQADATSTRASLGEMIERLRRENEEAADVAIREVLPGGSQIQVPGTMKNARLGKKDPSSNLSSLKQQPSMPNGHIRTPSRLPDNLERAMATMLKPDSDGQLLAQSAPYASMLGVVLIGVGLMAYLNSWQKIEK